MEEGAGRRGDGGLSAWTHHCRAGGCRSYQGAACQDRRASRCKQRRDRGTGFFGTRAASAPRQERKAMIQADHPILSIVQQCRLASIGRSTFYHAPRGESAKNLGLMVEIDRQFLETPFYGAQQMTWHLQAAERPVNIKRVRRLMRLMGLMPIYRQPRTSIPAKGHKLYPYLLRGVRID
ncbi:MAG: transposase, partial [Rhodospirillales bacterium]|nr:transposase [Rhodospirillales bacterium]